MGSFIKSSAMRPFVQRLSAKVALSVYVVDFVLEVFVCEFIEFIVKLYI